MYAAGQLYPRRGFRLQRSVGRRGTANGPSNACTRNSDGPSSLIGRAGPEKQDRHAQTGGDLVHPELQHIRFLHPPRCRCSAQRLSKSSGQPVNVQLENGNVVQG